MRAYKFTRPGAVGLLTGFSWPQPALGSPGSWVEASSAAMCRAGIHACRPAQLPFWVAEELWVIELDGEVVESATKLVAERGRLVEPVEAWSAGGDVAFGRDCALRARDLAVDALTAARLDGPASELGACSALDALSQAAAALARETAGLAGLLAGYAADSAHYAAAREPAVAAYVTAVAAGAAAGERRNDSRSPAALGERARQAAWAVEHLNLS